MPQPEPPRRPLPKGKVTLDDLRLSRRQRRWIFISSLVVCLLGGHAIWHWRLGEGEPTGADRFNLYLMYGFALSISACAWFMTTMDERRHAKKRQRRAARALRRHRNKRGR